MKFKEHDVVEFTVNGAVKYGIVEKIDGEKVIIDEIKNSKRYEINITRVQKI